MLGGLMMRTGISLALAFSILSLPAVASATGGVWCDIKDRNAELHFKASMSRDGTGGWWGIEGRLRTMVEDLPQHLADFAITDEALTQRWLGRDGVFMEIQKLDADPAISVMLSVVAKPVDEGAYEGSYELRIAHERSRAAFASWEGKVTCGAD
jgi:hypothetical protein